MLTIYYTCTFPQTFGNILYRELSLERHLSSVLPSRASTCVDQKTNQIERPLVTHWRRSVAG